MKSLLTTWLSYLLVILQQRDVAEWWVSSLHFEKFMSTWHNNHTLCLIPSQFFFLVFCWQTLSKVTAFSSLTLKLIKPVKLHGILLFYILRIFPSEGTEAAMLCLCCGIWFKKIIKYPVCLLHTVFANICVCRELGLAFGLWLLERN